MPGALINLIAIGVQDAYITGNPTITFFKALYRRHTNFALEAIEQTFNGMVDFGRSGVSATIARNGDLISRMYIKAKVNIKQNGPGRCAFVRNLGHSMLTEYSVLIGGAQIDKQCGEWMTIKNSLCMEPGQEAGYNQMVGNTPEMTELKDRYNTRETDNTYTIYVPLNFWFCNSYSQALPIIALQYHDVRVNVNFRDAASLVCTEGCSATVSIKDATLLIDYILLDTQERKLFATQPHEMLIEQLQYPTSEPFSDKDKKFRLTLNHPCKHVTWAAKLDKWSSSQQFLAYHPTDAHYMKLRAAKLVYLMSLYYSKYDGIKDPTPQQMNDVNGLYEVLSEENKGESIDFNINASGLKDMSTKFRFVDWKNPILKKVLDILKGKLIVMTNFSHVDASDEEDPDTKRVGAVTFGGFRSDPFSHVEIVDTSFLEDPVFDELISTTISSLSSLETLNQTPKDLAGNMYYDNMYSHFSKWFVTANMWDNFGKTIDGRMNPIDHAVIQINGQDRFAIREGNYFNYVQPFQHWPNTPADGINTYSFALKPAEYQPSGTLNFSRVDFAQLNLSSAECKKEGASLSYYTMNYNILRVLGGMGGVAYSN